MDNILTAARKKGRHGDTILAHITPEEAAMLKRMGGSGTINPLTGLPEFFGGAGGGGGGRGGGGASGTASSFTGDYKGPWGDRPIQTGGGFPWKELLITAALAATAAGGGALAGVGAGGAGAGGAGAGAAGAGGFTAAELAAVTAAGAEAGAAASAGIGAGTAAGIGGIGGALGGATTLSGGGGATGAGTAAGGATSGMFGVPLIAENAALGAGTAGAAGGAGTMSSWIMPAIAGMQVLSSVLGYKAAGDAAEAGLTSSREATAAQLEIYYDSVLRSAPWTEEGSKAVRTLGGNIAAGPGEFDPAQDPGYNFGYKEFVEKPLLQGASATGRLRSGNILRELSDRAQDYASTKYDGWLNRWLNTKINPNLSLAGLGQTSASNTNQMGTATGQGVAGNILAGGQAQAGGSINKANAITGGVKAGANTLLDAMVWNQMSGGKLFS